MHKGLEIGAGLSAFAMGIATSWWWRYMVQMLSILLDQVSTITAVDMTSSPGFTRLHLALSG